MIQPMLLDAPIPEDLNSDKQSKVKPEFTVERAIMHYLAANDSDEKLVTREIAFEGDAGEIVRSKLAELVQNVLGKAKIYASESSESRPSEAIALCRQMLRDPGVFTEHSHRLAKMLDSAMTRTHSYLPGNLLIVAGFDPDGACIALLKLKQLREIQYEYVKQPDDTVEVRLSPNENLVSSEGDPQKGAFVRVAPSSAGYDVQVRDNQAHKRELAARYFVEDFLGCQLMSTPTQMTLDFCRAAENWRQMYADYLPKQGLIAFTTALQDFLTRQPEAEVNFREFAEHALIGISKFSQRVKDLADALRQAVYEREISRGEPASESFVPDGAYAKKLLGSVSLKLSVPPNGVIELSAPLGMMLSILDTLRSDSADGDRLLTLSIESRSIRRSFS